MAKVVFITGGVCSSLGKGVTTASLGFLLEEAGLVVGLLKFDPYLNPNASLLSPHQHGEVYVLDDGSECDLDLGHYHRFTRAKLTRRSCVTQGAIYQRVLEACESGSYLGKTVQIVPHITDMIKQCVQEASEGTDVLLVEIGGTVGDIEAESFLEAARQLACFEPRPVFIHLALLPHLATVGELKTKPAQHSVAALRQRGIQPDIVVARMDQGSSLTVDDHSKLAFFCGLLSKDVFALPDADSIYHVPGMVFKSGLADRVLHLLNIVNISKDISAQGRLARWSGILDGVKETDCKPHLVIVGKYLENKDTYKSLEEAIKHAALHLRSGLDVVRLDASDVATNPSILANANGILVPGGFGSRGWDGKIAACSWAMKNKMPLFGICLGMQAMAVAVARDMGFAGADSKEFRQSNLVPVVHLHSDDSDMRVGAHITYIQNSQPSLANKALTAYIAHQPSWASGNATCVQTSERYRHRYEINRYYETMLKTGGLSVVGMSACCERIAVMEYEPHPWAVGVQFHPEYLSRLEMPHPLFIAFLQALIRHKMEQVHVR